VRTVGNTVGSLESSIDQEICNALDDPVTTEAYMAKVASPVQHGQIYGRHNTPTPRSLVEQGEDIVCAAGNGGYTCDVGSSHPGAGAGPKGWAVRPLKRHASWV
jgi:hypothetical protein